MTNGEEGGEEDGWGQASGMADLEAGGVTDPETGGKANSDGADMHAGDKANGGEAPLLYLTI